MQSAGLIKTADTGQINFATVVKPGASTAGGYEIYRFNDSMQATAPIFFKIEYGTGGNTSIPSIWLTVGSGSNGLGTITGIAITTRITSLINSTVTSTVTNYISNICVIDGFCGVAFKRGAASGSGYGGFLICRSVDSSGLSNVDGVTIYTCATSAGTVAPANAISYSTNLVYSGGTSYCLIGFAVTNSLSSGAIQTYKHYTITPRMRPNPFLLTCITSEINANTQFTATPVAGVTHNYISLGPVFGGAAVNGVSGTHGMCMVWE